ncbi:MAG TPA: hypothetical protein VI282_01180, partial [Verrucomicrobiae bacterium]
RGDEALTNPTPNSALNPGRPSQSPLNTHPNPKSPIPNPKSSQAPRHSNNSPQKISPPSTVPKLPLTNSQSPITNPSLDSTTPTTPTPRHSQPSSATPPKTPAISNPQTEPSKTFGHSQALPQKISSAPKSRTQTHAQPPTKIPDPQSPIPDQQPSPLPNPKRRIPDLLSTLSAQTKETIIAFCEETSSYKEAAQKILHHLNLKISPASLSKLYTNYGIADDQQTRDEIIAAHENQNPNPIPRDQIIRATAKKQLELRLLELSARRDHDHGQLKELFQIITRLEALALSERRVLVAERRIQLAEKRDQRQTQPPPQPSLNPLQIKRAVRISLGKSTDDIDAELARQAAAPAAMQTDSEQDQNEIIALCTKHLLGKEITLGDELIAEPDPSTIQTTHLTSHTTSCTHLT